MASTAATDPCRVLLLMRRLPGLKSRKMMVNELFIVTPRLAPRVRLTGTESIYGHDQNVANELRLRQHHDVFVDDLVTCLRTHCLENGPGKNLVGLVWRVSSRCGCCDLREVQ